MTPEEIKLAIREHKKYLNGDGGVRANLHGANLYGADLYGADLSDADLRRANLGDANLYVANLGDANLRRANLRRADLRRADLSDADLSGANLSGADLSSADLRGADLRRANLGGARGHGIIRIDVAPWSVCIYPDNRCSIGCETRDHEFWLNATPESVADMHTRAAAEWWRKNGPMIKAAIRSMEEKA